jgi:type I restriction enzyme S subunit
MEVATEDKAIRRGYKQTELGVIPEEWAVMRLGDVATFFSGGTPSTSVPSYYGGDIPWIVSGDLNKRFLEDVEGRITESGLRNSSAKVVEKDTLLVALYGATSGVPGITRIKAAINQAVLAIVPESESSMFLFYQLEYLRDWIVSTYTQGGQPNLSADIIRSVRVVVPSAREQQAIVAALCDVDALLEALSKLVAKKREVKTATMQQLLDGKRRLSGFAGGWETVSLGSLFTFKNGLNKGKEFFGEGTAIVNYMDVYRTPGLYSERCSGRVTVSKEEIKRFDVRMGDVFFTRTSETVDEIGLAAVVLDEPREMVFSGFLLRARPRDARMCNGFKRYCFASNEVRIQIVSRSSYTTRALTNGRLLSDVVIALPDLKEQEAIAEVLSDMDAEIASLESQRDKVEALKQGMMQQLLTGKIRLI